MPGRGRSESRAGCEAGGVEAVLDPSQSIIYHVLSPGAASAARTNKAKRQPLSPGLIGHGVSNQAASSLTTSAITSSRGNIDLQKVSVITIIS